MFTSDVFHQDSKSAAYAAAAVREGADQDCVGPSEPGWYWMPDEEPGAFMGPFPDARAAAQHAGAFREMHDACN